MIKERGKIAFVYQYIRMDRNVVSVSISYQY